MIVCVAGGRDFDDRTMLFDGLDLLSATDTDNDGPGIVAIVSGAARGADTIALDWAVLRGRICIQYPADWDLRRECRDCAHDRNGAGACRNTRMIREIMLTREHGWIPYPIVAMVTHGGYGTADFIRKIRATPVKLYRLEEWVEVPF